jgi:hypothetical protein
MKKMSLRIKKLFILLLKKKPVKEKVEGENTEEVIEINSGLNRLINITELVKAVSGVRRLTSAFKGMKNLRKKKSTDNSSFFQMHR